MVGEECFRKNQQYFEDLGGRESVLFEELIEVWPVQNLESKGVIRHKAVARSRRTT